MYYMNKLRSICYWRLKERESSSTKSASTPATSTRSQERYSIKFCFAMPLRYSANDVLRTVCRPESAADFEFWK